MRSAAFSRSASQRAASLDAPCTESTYTEAPVMLRSAIESACTDTNMSARATRARRMRSRSSRNSSRSRVSTARMPGSALMRSASARAMASVTSFSRVPPWPMAPGSWPPWPASTAMTTSRLPSSGACTACTGCGSALTATGDHAPRLSSSVRPRGLAQWAASVVLVSITTRSVPPGCTPKRTALTAPPGAGACTPAPRCVCLRSMTMRYGCSRVKSVGATASSRSRLSCAAAGCGASCTPRNSAARTAVVTARPHSATTVPR